MGEVVDGGLVGRVGGALADVDATMTLPRAVLDRFVLRESTIDDELAAGAITSSPTPAAAPPGRPARHFSIWSHLIEP